MKSAERIPLVGGVLLVLVCFLWGANVVSIRVSNQGIPPLLAASLRSAAAALLVWLYAWFKGYRVSLPKGERRHGWVIGCLFGLDFLFLYWGIAFTTASRSIVFLYTHPFWVALGAHFVLKGDRLNLGKGLGLLLAFSGLLAVFAAGSGSLPVGYWIGDLMEVGAALFWAATTVYIKKMLQKKTFSHYQTLHAQLLYSIPVLAAGSLLFERSSTLDVSGAVAAALAYQCVGVAFFSYVLWFWMISQFPVSNLTAFTFLAPLFGVILGAAALSEPVSLPVWLGLALIGAGIYMVNRSPRVV